jgi:predicted DNA-binding transcriptional regulator AlpA
MARRRPPFVKYGRVRELLCISPATFRAMIASGDFPSPIQLQPKTRVFAVTVLDAWAHRKTGRPFPLDTLDGTELQAS